jgi:hypothetical protein
MRVLPAKFADRKIAVVALLSFSNQLEHLRVYFPAVTSAVDKIKPGEITLVGNIP